jgi:hypothetical protein
MVVHPACGIEYCLGLSFPKTDLRLDAKKTGRNGPGRLHSLVSASGRVTSVQSFGCLTAARSPIVVIDGALIHQFPHCAETSFSGNQDLFKPAGSLLLFYVLFYVRFETAFLFEMRDARGKDHFQQALDGSCATSPSATASICVSLTGAKCPSPDPRCLPGYQKL